MKLDWIVVGIVLTFSSTFVIAKRLSLRPLTGEEVYRLLKDAKREDAIPQGRVITQGIAAFSGFALGLKSGIAIPLAFNLVSSNANAVQQYFGNLNYTALANSLPTVPSISLPTLNLSMITNNIPTINVTSLTSLLNLRSRTPNVITYTSQEICFSSENRNDMLDNRDYENENENGNDFNDFISYDDDYDNDDDVILGTARQVDPVTYEGDMTMTNDDDGDVDDGDGMSRMSQPMTQTGLGRAVNCIVIQNPVVGS